MIDKSRSLTKEMQEEFKEEKSTTNLISKYTTYRGITQPQQLTP